MEFFNPEAPKINWRQVFEDMKAKGYPKTRAATTIGKEWSTVQRWLDDGDPPHLYGEKILRLHSFVCGPELTERRRRGE